MEEFDFETWHYRCFDSIIPRSNKEEKKFQEQKKYRKEGWESYKNILEHDKRMEILKPTIKPCPFCGEHGKITYGGFGEIAVRCSNNNCGCSLGAGIWFNKEEDAIKFWNKRSNEKKPKWRCYCGNINIGLYCSCGAYIWD